MRKKLTKLMAVALALVMVAALVPVAALATRYSENGGSVGAVTEKSKTELLTRLEGATEEDGWIKLGKDIAITDQNGNFILSLDVKIDLNGHKLDLGKTGNNANTIGTYDGHTLEIKDSSSDHTGKLDGTVKAQYNGTVTLTDVNIEGNVVATAKVGEELTQTETRLTINGGSIKNTSSTSSALTVAGCIADVTDTEIESANADGEAVYVQEGSEENPAVLNMTGCTVTNSVDCGVFVGGYSTLNATNCTIKATGGFGISSNGKDDDEHKNAVINITGGEVEGAEVGMYLPSVGGKTTVKNAKVTGKTGIEIRAGELTVDNSEVTGSAQTYTSQSNGNGSTSTGGGIVVSEHSTKEKITVNVTGEKTKVNGAVAFAVDNPNKVEGAAENYEISIENGEFTSTEPGKSAVEVTDDVISDEEQNPMEGKVSGGTFKTSDGKADETVNAYVDPELVINEKTGKVETFTAKVVDFGYGATRIEALDAASKFREDWETDYWNPTTHTGSADWNDQTMWVTFEEAIPAGKTVTVTVTLGDTELEFDCVGNGTARTFAWSFLNETQTPNVGAKPGAWTLDGGDCVDTTGHETATVSALPDGVVHFATLTGNVIPEKDGGMTVTVKTDPAVGQYYEVRFDTEKLPQTNGNQTEAYWLGWALEAPEGAESIEVTKASKVADVLKSGDQKSLEQNVVGTKPGYALYYKADNPGTTADWVAVTWKDKDGKALGTTFIHVVFGNITFETEVEINAVDGGSGFKADKAEAEKAIKAVWDGIRTAESGPDDVADNTLWAIFQHKELQTYGINYKYQVRKDGVSTAIIEPSEDVTVKNGVLLYFSLDDQLSSVENKGGKYVIELLKDNLPVANAEVEVFEVTYKADKNVTGKDVTIYTDRAGLEAALADHPDGFEFTNGASMWDKSVSSNEKDPYTYEVKLNAYTYVAPPMPGTNPDNPDNPDNPPVVDPAKQFVDVPDVPANKWYRDALNYVLTTKPGVIEGTDGTHFSPNANLTRAAFAKILWALDGKETATAANPFTDVKAGAWYYDAVIWANAKGIMLGDAGRCKPEDNITREEMAVMIQRWLNGKAATTESKFTDAKDIHDWAAGAVNWAAEQGYIKGKDDGSFAPLATLTRAEMIVVVARTQGWIG